MRLHSAIICFKIKEINGTRLQVPSRAAFKLHMRINHCQETHTGVAPVPVTFWNGFSFMLLFSVVTVHCCKTRNMNSLVLLRNLKASWFSFLVTFGINQTVFFSFSAEKILQASNLHVNILTLNIKKKQPATCKSATFNLWHLRCFSVTIYSTHTHTHTDGPCGHRPPPQPCSLPHHIYNLYIWGHSIINIYRNHHENFTRRKKWKPFQKGFSGSLRCRILNIAKTLQPHNLLEGSFTLKCD